MKKLMMLAVAVTVLNLTGAVRATPKPTQAPAACCDGGACCGGACCLAK